MADDADKTEEATPKRLEDARKKGQVWKSRDFTGGLVFIAGIGVIYGASSFFFDHYREAFLSAFQKIQHAGNLFAQDDIVQSVYEGIYLVVLLTMPPVVGAAIIGAFVDFLITGGVFSFEVIVPKLETLNPVEGLKKMFSKKSIVEALKNTVKIIVAAIMLYYVLKGELRLITVTARATPALILKAAGSIVFKLCTRISVLFIVISIFDIWWQHRSFMKDMMMSKDEVKREYKESEGDPQHKQHRKQMHQEILEGMAMHSVAKSNVVVTNPDHYAVALAYDRENDEAPRVVAKGLNARAEAIKAIAAQAGVIEVRNVPLAHALFRIDVGEEIPEALYDAVAEVLNFVYAEQERRNRSMPS